jgi:signal peptide peptidase SppA
MRPLVAYLAQHRHWAVEAEFAERMVGVLNRHLAGEKTPRPAKAYDDDDGDGGAEASVATRGVLGYRVQAGVAVLPVQGVIAKYASMVNGDCQPRGTSSEGIQQSLADALADPSVHTIVMAFDSPGGSVAGTPDAASAVRAATKIKPVIGHAGDLCASAGYWLAAQCSRVIANQNALVGSIGVISLMVDSSKAMDEYGYKIHVLRSVALKAAGQPGEKITEEQVADGQRVIDDIHGMFVGAIRAARPLSDDQAAKAFTGQIFLPAEAQKLGLIDGVMSLEQLISTLTTTPITITGSAMKLTAAVVLALCASYPSDVPFIQERAQAGDEEGPLRTALSERAIKRKDDEIAALRQQLVDAKKVGDEALAAEKTAHGVTKTTLADLTKKHDALAKIATGAPEDVGGDPASTQLGTLHGKALHEAEWERSAELRREFFDNKAAYLGHRADEDKAKVAKK